MKTVLGFGPLQTCQLSQLETGGAPTLLKVSLLCLRLQQQLSGGCLLLPAPVQETLGLQPCLALTEALLADGLPSAPLGGSERVVVVL